MAPNTLASTITTIKSLLPLLSLSLKSLSLSKISSVLDRSSSKQRESRKMLNKDACSPSSNGGFGPAAVSGQLPSNGGYGSLYSALSNDNLPSLSANCSNGGGVSLYPYSDSTTQYDSCVIQKHQDMVNRQSMCLNRLVETSKEVDALRQENGQLRAANKELQKQLHLVIQASLESQYAAAGSGSSGQTQPTLFDVLHGFRSLHIGEGKENYADWNNNNNHNHNNILNNNNNKDLQEASDESPTSVMENNVVEVERFSLPKSISVRSNGYLKMAQSAALATNNNVTRNKGATRPRATATPPEAVKVYVRGGQKEEEPLEMVVYNQGMFKTELCNKWQETGTCPYGDHCQFAHGIGELRPVIRHPRYKTEVCRMVLAGVVCPYGHRCHFRHALTEQEKAVVSQPKPRTMKLER
ncbi:zinc finger CCCH domain-containing protein 15 isoform X2 [Vigna angularis]|uniref:zinc finger CCCH domain-containing protein 15 isoform X2 n=2 Tax=Vigna TaxID=3913 RepID=UPI0022B59769|nr:zinc finger CCCH domain-containing protein 15 isoform X2 [Vigna angularis]